MFCLLLSFEVIEISSNLDCYKPLGKCQMPTTLLWHGMRKAADLQVGLSATGWRLFWGPKRWEYPLKLYRLFMFKLTLCMFFWLNIIDHFVLCCHILSTCVSCVFVLLTWFFLAFFERFFLLTRPCPLQIAALSRILGVLGRWVEWCRQRFRLRPVKYFKVKAVLKMLKTRYVWKGN